MHLLFALAYLCIALHIPPLAPSSNVSSISEFVNNSNSTPIFFKHACHANPVAEKKLAGSSSYFSMHLSLHLQVVMHQIEHISHDTHIDFLF